MGELPKFGYGKEYNMKNGKRILSALLAAVMGVSAFTATAGAVGNDSDSNDRYYDKGDTFGYYAEKVSHAGKDVKTTDGIVDYLGNGVVGSTDSVNGNGDRCQNYAWSALADGDNIYIGTCASAVMQTLKFMQTTLGSKFDNDVVKATFDAMFNGSFYFKEDDDGDPKGILLKLNTKTGDVKLLMSKATTGQDVQLRNGVEYNGKFYFCGSVSGIPSIVMVDPETDECKVVYQSMTLAEYYQAYLKGICVIIRGMCEYNGQLIVSMVKTVLIFVQQLHRGIHHRTRLLQIWTISATILHICTATASTAVLFGIWQNSTTNSMFQSVQAQRITSLMTTQCSRSLL